MKTTIFSLLQMLWQDSCDWNTRTITYTGLPLFTGCEIQGLFQDFPGPFQANRGPSLSKLECFTPFFFLKSVRQYTYCINKLYYSALQFDFSSNYGWKAKKGHWAFLQCNTTCRVKHRYVFFNSACSFSRTKEIQKCIIECFCNATPAL